MINSAVLPSDIYPVKSWSKLPTSPALKITRGDYSVKLYPHILT